MSSSTKASKKKAQENKTNPAKPKKLSKVGEWMRAHPKGVEVIYIDWKAVLK
jgi:hypothetical protein